MCVCECVCERERVCVCVCTMLDGCLLVYCIDCVDRHGWVCRYVCVRGEREGGGERMKDVQIYGVNNISFEARC